MTPDYWALSLLAVLLPVLVAGVIVALRRPAAPRESGWTGAACGLYSPEGLLAEGGALLARCRQRGEPLTLALFDCSDLLEVRKVYGPAVAGLLGVRLASRLVEVAGRSGLAARTGLAEFVVLLPGRGPEPALRAIQKVLGSPCRIEYESGRDEVVLLPELVLAQAGREHDGVAALRDSALRQLVAAREQEALRRLQMRRSRERHSQPGRLSPDAVRAARERALARTEPMPLTAST